MGYNLMASGRGWAGAGCLPEAGCKVGLTARRRDLLEKLAGEITAAGGVTAFASADAADREQTLHAIHEIAGKLGPADLLVANAGVGAPTNLDPVNTADVE